MSLFGRLRRGIISPIPSSRTRTSIDSTESSPEKLNFTSPPSAAYLESQAPTSKAAAMSPQADTKRKASGQHVAPHRAIKRVKVSEARTILAQSTDKALSQGGELDVPAYVKAREFEIQSLEKSVSGSKKALSTRAFQEVPRELRRRTASHNVKKVPKRLRKRAAKEMKDDNTPIRRRKPTPQQRLRTENARRIETIKKIKAKKAQSDAEKGKALEAAEADQGEDASHPELRKPTPARPKPNTLQEPDNVVMRKFQKRQIHKTWLPTHMFHAKRAHMPLPKQPLWRFAVPLTPTEKSYRPTHRAGWMRGCVAWDTSYMGTIALEGVEPALLILLRSVGVEEKQLTGTAGQRWRRGTRHWKGWIRERDTPQRWIAPVQAVWCLEPERAADEPAETQSKKKGVKRRLFVRVHPAAFLQVWEELLKVGKMQRPPVAVEDLRFELGSIELMGPGSTEALVAVLRPSDVGSAGPNSKQSLESTWNSLVTLSNPASLPAQAMLASNVSDPRLHHPSKTMKSPDDSSEDQLLELLAHWPPDDTQITPAIFSRAARSNATSVLSSQKAINRRRSELLPGCASQPRPDDPRIPTLLLASRCANAATKGQGRWTVLLPWNCVAPVWYSLMHYPLSTGGTLRFGGLDETRQIAFEQGVPWFPGDFPGTRAGWEWELREREKGREEWGRKPQGRRIEWESVDLGEGRRGEVGLGWGCDWERLFGHGDRKDSQGDVTESRPSSGEGATADATQDQPDERDEMAIDKPSIGCQPSPSNNQANPIQGPNPPPTDDQTRASKPAPLTLHQFPTPLLLPSLSSLSLPLHSLITITLHLPHRGVPTRCARIYRLPASNSALRAQWLLQASSSSPPAKASSRSAVPKPGEEGYPVVPGEEDLIGFVTTGNFNLAEGRGFGVGCLAVERVWGEVKGDGEGKGKGEEGKGGRWCVVRNAGCGVGRVARWEVA